MTLFARAKSVVFPALVVVVAIAVCANAAADESPLTRIPDDAVAVLHVKGWYRTRGRIVELIEKALPGEPAEAMIEQMNSWIDQMLDGRQIFVSDDESVFLVLSKLPAAGKPPEILLIAPITDYAAFRNGLLTPEERGQLQITNGQETTRVRGIPIFLVDHGKYATLSNVKQPARLSEKPSRFASKLPKGIADRLLASDVALCLDLKAINSLYEDEIAEAGGAIQRFVLQQFQEKEVRNKEWKQLMRTLVNGLIQFVQDSEALLVTVNVPVEGVEAHLEVIVKSESESAQFFQTARVGRLPDIEALPRGYLTYRADQGWSDSGPPALAALQELMKSNPASLKAVKESTDQVRKGVELACQRNRLGLAGLHIVACDDPKQMAESELSTVGTAEVTLGVMKSPPQIERSAATHRGFTLHKVTSRFELDTVARLSDVNRKGVESLGARQTEILWIGHDKARFVTVGAETLDDARRILDDYLDGKNSLSGDPAFREARRHLPEQASDLMFEEISDYFQAMARFQLGNLQAKFNLPDAVLPRIPPRIKGLTAYYGMATTFQPGRVAIDLWAPGIMAREYDRVVGAILLQLKERSGE
ncbi:MAG: hypothetical protein ACKV2Q_05195 [Planctomycetaceae bacterium]